MLLLRRHSLSFLLTLLLPILPSYGQEASDGTLRVLRPLIHAEQDRAEFCLEFDHTLDDSDRARSALNIRLESIGKTNFVPEKNVTFTAATLCIPSLEHGKNYHLTLSGIKGTAGEKLNLPYQLSFKIPDRNPSLAFLSDLFANGMMRWQDNDPVLRAININQAKIELYRIDKIDQMTEAWQQHKQTTLAPSESAYFARDKGHLIWSGDVHLNPSPNKAVEQKISLHENIKDLPNGFYLVVASAAQSKSDEDKHRFAPNAAAWLLRSNLKAKAYADKDGFFVTCEKADASDVLPNIHLLLEDNNHKILLEGRSSDDGTAHLPLSGDAAKQATVLVANDDNGNVDFADLVHDANISLPVSSAQATLRLDQEVYSPGMIAELELNGQVKLTDLKHSQIQILRSDKSLFAAYPWPTDGKDTAHLSLPVPSQNGSWPITWKAGDKVLAETVLRVSSNSDAPHLEVSADRMMLSGNEIALNLKSLTSSGKPASFIPGRITLSWITPETLFPEWKDFQFGMGHTDPSPAVTIANFLTDSDGQAQLRLDLPTQSESSSLLRAAKIDVESDPASGTADPMPIILPVKPADYIIGVKPSAADGHFAENSMARFEAVALDANGARREANNLSYQILEEGRSFDWYQDSGHWNYKPLQQTRPVGGGSFNIKAEGNNHIEWPVHAGNYQLVIRDASDHILVQTHFSAGWIASANDNSRTESIDLNVSPPDLYPNRDVRVHFHLNQPGIITAIIADDRIRKIIHKTATAGDNNFTFTPERDWADSVTVSVSSRSIAIGSTTVKSTGHITLYQQKGIEKKASAASIGNSQAKIAFSLSGDEIPVLHQDDVMNYILTLKNNSGAAASYHYSFTTSPGLKIAGPGQGAKTVAANQDAEIPVTLQAAESGNPTLKATVTGPHGIHANASWSFTVIKGESSLSSQTEQEITAGQSWSFSIPKITAQNRIKHDDHKLLFLSPHPLFHFPDLLAERLAMNAFTTQEIADEIDLLHLWQTSIQQIDLASDQQIMARRHELVLNLLMRQHSDGGFSDVPGGTASFSGTAAALRGLSLSDESFVAIAKEQAASWLHHKLDNNWFDEAERPQRAEAFASLFLAGYYDTASLNYFADNSTSKNLPSLAAAQLALAFSKIKDQDKTVFWLSQLKNLNNADITASILPWLAQNEFYSVEKLTPAFNHILQSGHLTFYDMTAFLRSEWYYQNHFGNWRVDINGHKDAPKNILIVSPPTQTAPLHISNPNDYSLFVASAIRNTKNDDDKNSLPTLTRHIYHMNGSEVAANEALNRNQIYFVGLEGEWKGENEQLMLRDTIGPALSPVSCALADKLFTPEAQNWIKDLSLTQISACEKIGATLNIMLKNTPHRRTWHTLYIAKAIRAGFFQLPSSQARTTTVDPDNFNDEILFQAPVTKIRIN